MTQTITWDDVARVFENDRCNPDCPWLMRFEDRHPYGMGTAVETHYECVLKEEKGSPADCPVATPEAANDEEAT